MDMIGHTNEFITFDIGKFSCILYGRLSGVTQSNARQLISGMIAYKFMALIIVSALKIPIFYYKNLIFPLQFIMVQIIDLVYQSGSLPTIPCSDN
jgi:hypothetical protein